MEIVLDAGSVVEFDKRNEHLQTKDRKSKAVVYESGDKDTLYKMTQRQSVGDSFTSYQSHFSFAFRAVCGCNYIYSMCRIIYTRSLCHLVTTSGQSASLPPSRSGLRVLYHVPVRRDERPYDPIKCGTAFR